MATIHKLKKDGSTIYPATITDAVVHQDTGATLTEMVDSYNVTHLYPTSGLSGGSTYNLSGALTVLNSHLTAAEKKTGIHVVFTDANNTICDYIYQGGTFTTTSSWTLAGDIHTAPETEGSSPVPGFDPYTDTLHVISQTLSGTQKAQVLTNLGPDSEPTPGSTNIVTSGGVAANIIYDVSANNNNIIFSSLSDLLGNANLSTLIPSSIRRGGMSIKFVQEITPASYSVVKTEGLENQPTGTELSGDPGINSGTYTASQLSAFSSLPTSTGAGNAITYWIEVTGDTTTYTSWVITLVSVSDNKYIQARCMAQNFTTNVTQWQGVDDEPIASSNNLVKSGGVAAVESNIERTIFEKLIEVPVGYTPNVGIEVTPDESLNGYYSVDTKSFVSNTSFTTKVYSLSRDTYYQVLPTVTGGAFVASVTLFKENEVIFISHDTTLSSFIIKTNGFTKIAIVGSAAKVSNVSYTLKSNSVTQDSIADNSVTTSKIADNQINSSKLKNNSVTIEKIKRGSAQGLIIPNASIALSQFGFVETGKNLFNPNTFDVELNTYVYDDGYTTPSTSYNTSGYIPVKANTTYILSRNGSSRTARFISFLDKEYKKAGEQVTNSSSFTTTASTAYVRFSIQPSYWDNLQLEEGSTITQYEAYYERIKQSALPPYPVIPDVPNTDAVESILGTVSVKAVVSLNAGTAQSLSTFPMYLKKGIKISLDLDITTMGAFYIGRGYQYRGGQYLKIDASNITPVSCDTSGIPTEKTSIAHNLTISDNIKVILNVDDSGVCKIVIQTIGGQFSTDINAQSWENAAGNVFVRSVDFAGSGNILCTHEDIRKPVWIVGDSYLSISRERWPYYLKQLGIKNFLIEAVPGGNSGGTSYNVSGDFQQRLVNFGTPKFIVWCLGMNNGDSSSDTPSSNWLSAVENMLGWCENKNIIPILATIPNVATIKHEAKNNWVKNSGKRFIDFAKAVGGEVYTEGVDNWYTGYNGDGVHPSELGAKALAAQVLVDFPEIMEY